jgi:DNA-binding Lrp family transcriptional regulator
MAAQLTTPTIVEDNVIILKMADSKIPEFKEARNRNYIKYGVDNMYPQYLTYLFNKSAKHNAILVGKAFYVFGKGFENGDLIINRLGESLNDVSKKCTMDVEVYGGFRVEVIYNYRGKIAEVYHVDYTTLRLKTDGNYLFNESWDKFTKEEDAIEICAFNPDKPYGNQIFAYNEYRPNVKYYPLPTYIGCNNYIETDIEISKYYLSAIRNGMTPSKMVQFFEGEPPEEKKQKIEGRFKQKFAGAENAGNIILVFSKLPDKKVEISDLSATDLDKQFIEMNKTCQQEIFSGHLVTSPMLFGIKTEGQLGGNTELRLSYNLFQNTYSKPKAQAISKEFEYLLSYSIFEDDYELEPTDPIGTQFDLDAIVDILPKSFILKSVGVPEEDWGDITPTGQPGGQGSTKTMQVNDNIKNLTGRQHQALDRIIRRYKSGRLPERAARTLLRTSLGLSDVDINDLLEIKLSKKNFTLDEVIDVFDGFGDIKDDFEIIKSKAVSFSSVSEKDELQFIEEAFADMTTTEARILELIKKDSKINPQVIANTLRLSVKLVESKIDSLIKRGFIETAETKIGSDIIIERTVPKDILLKDIKINKKPASNIFIKYSYEGPKDDRNRPFCRKLLDLNRLYSRADIERISERLGYSVFDRRGGFWRHPDGEITPWCRHIWKSNIVIQK